MEVQVWITSGSIVKSDLQIKFQCALGKESFLNRLDEIIEMAFIQNQKIDITVYGDHIESFNGSTTYVLEQETVYDSIHFFVIRKSFKVIFANSDMYKCISELTKIVRDDVLSRLKSEVIDHEVA